MLTLVPRPVLERLGVTEHGKRRFLLADGTRIERAVGMAAFRYRGEITGTDVIFGEPHDKPLVGVVALEQLGLATDPTTGELKPLEMLLVGIRGPER
jgi:predicted aspartyl protease